MTVKVIKDRAQKWLWIGLAVLVALNIYFVRALLAAEILFAVLFGIVLLLWLVLFLVEEISRRSIAWAESQAQNLIELTRHRVAHLEELSRKSFRWVRSLTAQS